MSGEKKESMPVLEGRALTYIVRHAIRSFRNVGKRILILGDSITTTLAVSKGRSSRPEVLGVARQVAAMALAFGLSLHLRWIPSEFNVADDPSRLSSHRVIASLLTFARALTLQGRL